MLLSSKRWQLFSYGFFWYCDALIILPVPLLKILPWQAVSFCLPVSFLPAPPCVLLPDIHIPSRLFEVLSLTLGFHHTVLQPSPPQRPPVSVFPLPHAAFRCTSLPISSKDGFPLSGSSLYGYASSVLQSRSTHGSPSFSCPGIPALPDAPAEKAPVTGTVSVLHGSFGNTWSVLPRLWFSPRPTGSLYISKYSKSSLIFSSSSNSITSLTAFQLCSFSLAALFRWNGSSWKQVLLSFPFFIHDAPSASIRHRQFPP